MNDEQLKALIRDSVERHLGRRAVAPPPTPRAPGTPAAGHASHDVYVTLVNAGEACLIEPSVPCTHCEYCRSHGH